MVGGEQMYFQQQPTFLEGLISGFMSQREKNQEQKRQENMFLDATKFGEDLNNLDMGGQTTITDLASRANPNSNYTNKTASLKAQQGLLPTSFNQTVPTSDTLGQGLLGMPKQQVEQQPQRFFADPNIATDMQPDTTPLLGKYAKENNPVNITTSAPKTLQEQTRMINAQIPKKMQEMIKAGYNPKEALTLLKESANQAISDRTEKYKQQQMSMLTDPNLDVRQKLQIGLQLGLKPEEMKMLTQRLTNPTMRNMGDRDQPVAFDPYAGQYINTVTGQPLTEEELKHGISPTAVYNKTTVSEDAKYKIANRPAPTYGGGGRGGNYGGSSRTSTPKLGKEENWALGYESGNGLTNDTALIEGLSALDNPTPSQQIQLDKALGRRDHYWKVSSGGQYGAPEQQEQSQGGNDDGAAWYDREYRNAINEGLTPEQATQYLSDIIKQNGG